MDFIIIFILIIFVLSTIFYFFYYLKVPPKTKSDDLYTKGLNFLLKGDDKGALELFRQVVKQNSNHINAYLQLGNILRKENAEQAVKIHQSLTVRFNLPISTQVDIHQALALDYQEMKRLDLAKFEAEQVLRLENNNIWGFEFLLDIAEKTENWDMASQLTKKFKKYISRRNKKELSRFDIYQGLKLKKDGKVDEALSFFRKAIKHCPDNGLPFKYIGDIYESSRDLVKAVENWELFALKDQANSYKVFKKIELALFDLGRYSEVENFYRRILENNSNSIEAVIRLANVLEEKGENQAAISLIEEMSKVNNGDIRSELMKLKLSLKLTTPSDLGIQIDKIVESLSNN